MYCIVSKKQKVFYQYIHLLRKHKFHMADLRSNEQIDRLNDFRKDHGQEPLAYEIVDENAEAEKIKNDKIAADAETERLRIEAEAKEKEGQQNNPPTPTPTKAELTKEEKEAIAREYFGVTDLSDLVKKSEFKKEPTADEIEAAKEQRENDKIAYALKNGKISKKQYESFIADAKDPQGLVFAQYVKEQKELDPTLTVDGIKTEFEIKFGLDEEEGSRKHKRGLKEIGILAETILKQNYDNIYKIDSEYNAYENEQLTQKQISEKLISDAPNYKRTVEEVYEGLKKLPIKMANGDSYEVEMPDDVINALKQRELNTEYAANQIKKGYTKEDKSLSAQLTMIYENLPTIIQSVADKINAKRQAGSKGIPPIDGNNPVPTLKKLTPEQEESRKRIYGDNMPVAN